MLQQYICWGWAELSVQPQCCPLVHNMFKQCCSYFIRYCQFGPILILQWPPGLPLPTTLPPQASPLILTLPLPLPATLPSIFDRDRYTDLLPFCSAYMIGMFTIMHLSACTPDALVWSIHSHEWHFTSQCIKKKIKWHNFTLLCLM